MNIINFKGMPRKRSDQMNSMLDEFYGRGISDFFQNNWQSSGPSVNVTEEEGEYLIDIAAPGLERDDFEVNIKDKNLIVSVKKEKETEKKSEKYLRQEFNYTSFDRQFELPQGVVVDQISAEYHNGVLKINLPKQEQEKEPVRRIEIA